jgi:DNA-binding NarL/FixJ family response regulator
MKRITVLLADDTAHVRQELKKVLGLEGDIEIVGEAKNGLEAVAMAKKLRPALVLMDIRMPKLNGLEATRKILKMVPATKILIISSHGEFAYLEAAINSGAMGYVLKQSPIEKLCFAIRAVHRGETCFGNPLPIATTVLNLDDKASVARGRGSGKGTLALPVTRKAKRLP